MSILDLVEIPETFLFYSLEACTWFAFSRGISMPWRLVS